jgi:hypothetical protein
MNPFTFSAARISERSMKKATIVALCLFGLVIITPVAFVAYTAATIMEPHIIRPTATTAAGKDAKAGYVYDQKTHVLLVTSDQDMVVVCDPGVAFKYEVIWVVPHSRTGGDSAFLESRYALSEFTRADQIFSTESAIPPKILKTANGPSWN